MGLIASALNFSFLFFAWRRPPFGLGAWAPIGLFIVFMAATIIHLRRARGIAKRMIVTQDGISLYSPNSTYDPIPWPLIKFASCSWVDGSLRIERTDNKEPITFSHHVLGGVRIGRRCAAEINRLKGIYSPDTMVTVHESER
jgi:hypothetical protein